MEMERARDAVERYKRATSLPVMVQPNAGKPQLINMKVVYDETPEQMVKGLVSLLKTGANIVGSCCGSSPEHIRAFRKVMDEFLASGKLKSMEACVKVKICDVNPAAEFKLPQHTGDKSGIGVHYVDAFIKPMNVKLEDGTPVRCKRRGLKIVLSVGTRKGEGLMRRVDVSAYLAIMLNAALQEAAKAAGMEFRIEEERSFARFDSHFDCGLSRESGVRISS